jgi:hypothetical protein
MSAATRFARRKSDFSTDGMPSAESAPVPNLPNFQVRRPDTMSADEVCRLAQNLARNRGYSVFPCREDKRPACTHGFKQASTDPDAIAELWRHWPGPLIGVACGEVSGFGVLDLDTKHTSARVWWRNNYARLPRVFAYRTRTGGVHLFFVHVDGMRCSVGRDGGPLPPGVDIRAKGGYICYWPAAGYPILDPSPPAPWPEWLLERLRPKPPLDTPSPHVHTWARDRGIDALIRVVATAPEGNRNARLFWSACRVSERIREGEISRRDAEAWLLAAALHTGLPEAEARATIRSGLAR